MLSKLFVENARFTQATALLRKAVFVQRGSIIGVYFKRSNPLPVIGHYTSGGEDSGTNNGNGRGNGRGNIKGNGRNGRFGTKDGVNISACVKAGTERLSLIICQNNETFNTLAIYAKATISKLKFFYYFMFVIFIRFS